MDRSFITLTIGYESLQIVIVQTCRIYSINIYTRIISEYDMKRWNGPYKTEIKIDCVKA